MITILCYPKCGTCKKAEKWLKENNIDYKYRPIKEENPRFSALVYALQKCIELQCRKMLTSGQKLGIVEYNEITWYGRVDLLHRWISDNITLF